MKFYELLQNKMDEKKITVEILAEEAGMEIGHLQSVLDGAPLPPESFYLMKIQNILDSESSDIYELGVKQRKEWIRYLLDNPDYLVNCVRKEM